MLAFIYLRLPRLWESVIWTLTKMIKLITLFYPLFFFNKDKQQPGFTYEVKPN